MTFPLRQLEGKYEILAKLREGGMGAIYKVRHLLLDEVRVIKVIRPQFAGDETVEQRFFREAKTAIRLRHPNIAQLYDFAVDETDGTAFIVMEFIDGVTVQEIVAKSGRPGLGLALEIAAQGLAAIGYLHQHGYVHRDIAPDNLMLTRSFDGAPLIKLIDLGIVKRLGADADLTQTGMFLGKVRYSSPEQFSPGEGKLDGRSDLYSFGVLLYELLTGRCPITGASFSDLAAGHLFREPLGFDVTDPQGRVPAGLRQVVLKALEKKPADRHPTAERFIAALGPFKEPSPTVEKDLERTLRDSVTLLAEGGERPEPGSTQSKLDQHFRPVTTPPPTPAPGTAAAERREGAGPAPVATPGAPEAAAGPGGPAPAPPADRARQLAEAAATIEGALRGGSLDLAAEQLDYARRRFGDAAELAALGGELRRARQAAAAAREPGLAGTRLLGRDTDRLEAPPEDAVPRQRRWLPWAAAAALVAALGAGSVWWLNRPHPLPAPVPGAGGQPTSTAAPVVPAAPGTLILDALPWAEVTAITDAEGDSQPLPPATYTPLHLALPAGVYTVALAHPELAAARRVLVEIRPEATTRRTVELVAVDLDAYFRRAGF